jgi:hypothetical protein
MMNDRISHADAQPQATAMSSILENLKTQLVTLSPSEKAELGLFLLSALEPEDEDTGSAWDAVISQRVNEIRSASATGRLVEDLLGELHDQYP